MSHVRLILAIALLSIIASPVIPQTTPVNQSRVLIEFTSKWLSWHEWSFTTRVHADGRYVREGVVVEQTKSGRSRKVSSREQKQLEPEEVAELVGWAEQPDFINAQSEYFVRTVPDYPSYIAISYQNKGKQKNVKVFNYTGEDEAAKRIVPPSVLRLVKWKYGR